MLGPGTVAMFPLWARGSSTKSDTCRRSTRPKSVLPRPTRMLRGAGEYLLWVSHSRLGAVSDQQVGRIEHRVQQQFAVRDLHLCDRPGNAEAKRQTVEEAELPPGECGLILQDDLRLTFVNGLDVVNQLRREKAPTTVFLIIGTAFTLLMLAWMWKVIRRRSIRVEDDARPVSSSGRRDRQLR